MSTESVKRRVHVWPARLLWLGVIRKMAVIIYDFYDFLTVTLFQDVISFQTLFWDPKCLMIEVLMKRRIFKDYSLNF